MSGTETQIQTIGGNSFNGFHKNLERRLNPISNSTILSQKNLPVSTFQSPHQNGNYSILKCNFLN